MNGGCVELSNKEKKAADTYTEEAPKKKKKKKKKSNPVKKTFAVIGTTLLSLVLIVLITGSILAAAMTVYVVQFVQNTTIDIDLDSLDEQSSSFIYAYDENDALVQMKKLSRNVDRVPVSIDEIPQHVQNAFVYTEDARFFEHQGVDWKRTFGAFINEIVNIWGTRQGGSTITQQLVKNVTGDSKARWDRKMREIIRASQIEQYCTKSDILEAYLNYIGFGGKTAGIEAASQKYFGKHVGELTIAEGACLAGIPKNPEVVNPWVDPEACLERQKIVLSNMLEYGAISEHEYNAAVNEEIHFRSRNDVDNSYTANDNGIQNWFVDMVIDDVINDFMDLYGIEYEEASDRLYNGGYKVYTTCDVEMQLEVEKKYQDYSTFSDTVLTNPPQSAFIAMDYNGNILAVVGAVGEKAGDNVLNYATMTWQQPGSCIKPITTYSYGIEHDIINYSSIFIDQPIEIEDENDYRATRQWPSNYTDIWSMENVFIYQALERSLNTVPAQLAELIGPNDLLSFVQNKYQISTLAVDDANLAPMAVGALTDGVYLRELVAAYQPFGNLGKYYTPTSYTRVEGPGGELVLDHAYTPIQSIGEDTAYIMNKMMQQVISGPNGTGTAAQLRNIPVAGKTGTTQNYADLLFVGCTPNYVSGIWYGYDNNESVEEGTYYSAAQIWKNVFGDIAEKGDLTRFPECNEVEEYYFCAETGLISNGNCKQGGVGYYKKSSLPETCTVCKGSHSNTTRTDPEETSDTTSSEETTAADEEPAETEPEEDQ